MDVRAFDEDVWRIRIDSNCGLSVNVYVVRSEDAVIVFDTGFSHTTSELQLGLAKIGIGLADITHVFLTHTHHDHMGGAAALSEWWNAEVFLCTHAEPAARDFYAFAEARADHPQWPREFVGEHEWNSEPVARFRDKPINALRAAGSGKLRQYTAVDFGARVSAGAFEFLCVDGRGHDPAHCLWFEGSRRWVFSGDVVLSVPVPLVAATGDNSQLWRASAQRLGDLGANWMFPGHGVPTQRVAAMVERSISTFENISAVVDRELDKGELVEPMQLVKAILPEDSSRFAARTRVILALVETILHERHEAQSAIRIGHRWLKVRHNDEG